MWSAAACRRCSRAPRSAKYGGIPDAKLLVQDLPLILNSAKNFSLVLFCTELVQTALNSIPKRDFNPRRRHFHTVFNRTVENFHTAFTKIFELRPGLARKLLLVRNSRSLLHRRTVVTFLSVI
jgi:hypothetical protein